MQALQLHLSVCSNLCCQYNICQGGKNIKREGGEENPSDTNPCYSKARVSIKESHKRPRDLIQIPSEGGRPIWHDQVPFLELIL